MNKNNLISLILFTAIGAAIVGGLALRYHGVDLLNSIELVLPTPTSTIQEISTLPLSPVTVAKNLSTPTPGLHVCTGIADGHLLVRIRPGHEASVVGILSEAVSISPTGQRNGGWLEINAPLVGWVNTNFICEEIQP